MRPASARRSSVTRIATAGACLALCSAALSLPGGRAAAADQVAFTIKDPRITESSGLTRDVDGHRYWTVNDSGDSARAFAISPSGAVEGFFRYRAKVQDTEAVQYYGGALYVADIGDNLARRQVVTVYKFPNPQPNGQTVQYEAYDFTYPDGPRNAETMLINKSGRIFFVSKEGDGGVYEAPALPSRLRSNTLTRVANAPAYVTDGDFLSDGKRIALRTYVSVLILDAKTYKVVAQEPTPAEKQGESVTVDLAGTSLLVGSEGIGQPVYRIPIPVKGGTAPTGGPTPGTPTPTAPRTTAAPTDDGSTSDSSNNRSGSTALTLALAGAVALVAGLITLLARSRR